jgi:hypothetical protein
MSVLRATPKDRETAALLVPASRAVNDGLELIRTNRRRPATAPTTPSSAAGKASPYPLLGERPLELGERSENTEEETSNPRFSVLCLNPTGIAASISGGILRCDRASGDPVE